MFLVVGAPLWVPRLFPISVVDSKQRVGVTPTVVFAFALVAVLAAAAFLAASSASLRARSARSFARPPAFNKVAWVEVAAEPFL